MSGFRRVVRALRKLAEALEAGEKLEDHCKVYRIEERDGVYWRIENGKLRRMIGRKPEEKTDGEVG